MDGHYSHENFLVVVSDCCHSVTDLLYVGHHFLDGDELGRAEVADEVVPRNRAGRLPFSHETTNVAAEIYKYVRSEVKNVQTFTTSGVVFSTHY